MSTAALSKEVKTFIDENISTFEDLQVLLLMHGRPGYKWDAAAVAEQLRIDPISASSHLMKLYARGLISHKTNKGILYDFEYSPHVGNKEHQISALAAAFERARTEVIDYIFLKSRGQLQSFADAFKVKKD